MKRSQFSNLKSQIPRMFLAGLWMVPVVASLALGVAELQDPASQVVIVVVGAAGESEYAAQFVEWAGLWLQACAKGHARVVAIGLDEAGTSPDRDRIQAVLSKEAGPSNAALWLVLIGHGTYDGKTARFNLRGPDLSADDLSGWLKPVLRPVAVINAASSSAPFLKALSKQDRIVITATKSGFEQSFTRFGHYLAEAIVDLRADLDKDGQTSLLEAFLFASSGVLEFYSAAGRLSTEHPLLDDNGDGLGTPADWFRGIRPVKKASDNASLDGYRAHQLHLVYSQAEASLAPDLRAQRDRLELEVMTLRDARQSLSEEAYYTRLEALLVEMARIYEQ